MLKFGCKLFVKPEPDLITEQDFKRSLRCHVMLHYYKLLSLGVTYSDKNVTVYYALYFIKMFTDRCNL